MLAWMTVVEVYVVHMSRGQISDCLGARASHDRRPGASRNATVTTAFCDTALTRRAQTLLSSSPVSSSVLLLSVGCCICINRLRIYCLGCPMAASIHSPWIVDYLISVAEEHGANLSAIPWREKGGKAQLVKFLTFPPAGTTAPCKIWAEVSDKKHVIRACLTADAVQRYMEYVFCYIACCGEPPEGARSRCTRPPSQYPHTDNSMRIPCLPDVSLWCLLQSRFYLWEGELPPTLQHRVLEALSSTSGWFDRLEL
ncbi:hypothetical protein C8Q80DRAFT_884110 [Daedaleopsis nitida]|nr:hypothetical protein C8Q80DRAFT_884110 [Daedaleopsis nitida]